MILKDLCHIFRAHWSRSRDGQGLDLAIASSEDIDPWSGVVRLEHARHRRLESRGCERKYWLEAGDTIMAFNGALNPVGFPGYVEKADEPAVPALSMCVLRPKGGIDPVWLHFRLRCMKDSIRNLSVKSEGRETYFLRMEMLAGLEIPGPAPGEIEKVNAIFSEIMEMSRKRDGIAAEMLAKGEEIARIMGEIEKL